MKKLNIYNKFLTSAWILIFGLSSLILPIQIAEAACGYVDAEAKEMQKSCSEQASMYWDCPLNRCMRRPESDAIRNEFESCQGVEDLDARKKCFDDVAKKETEKDGGDFSAEGPDSGAYDTVLGATVGLAAINFFVKDDKNECLSKTTFMAGAVVGLLAEAYFYFFVEKKFKQLVEDYEKETVDENSYDAQVKAFEYLKEEQETIADVSKKKAIAYKVIAAIYAATAVIAIAEVAGVGMFTKMCEGKDAFSENKVEDPLRKIYPSDQQKEQWMSQMNSINDPLKRFVFLNEIDQYLNGKITHSPTQQTYNELKEKNPFEGFTKEENSFALKIMSGSLAMLFPSANAADDDKDENTKDSKDDEGKKKLYRILIGAAGGAAAGYLIDMPSLSSYVIIGLSGIAAFLSWKLAAAHDEQVERAKKNAELLDAIIAEFKDAMGNQCTDGRDDLNVPECYCTLPGSNRNPERENSAICQAYWAKAEGQNLFVAAHDYNKDPKVEVGCMTQEGKFDRFCKCKKFKNNRGDNACFKAPSAIMGLGGLGSNISGNGLKPIIDAVGQDGSAVSNINGGDAAKFAAKNKKTFDKALAKFNKTQTAKGAKPLFIDEKRADDFLKKKVNPAFAASAGSGGGLGVRAANLRPGAKDGALKKALEKAGLDKVKYSGGKKAVAQATTKKKKFDFFGSGDAKDSSNGKNINFMKKDYDYSDNDIVKRDGVSIWKVLTNRYNTSGLKRLFEDDL